MASELSLTEGEEQRWASFLQPPLTLQSALCTVPPFVSILLAHIFPFSWDCFLELTVVLYKILLSEC